MICNAMQFFKGEAKRSGSGLPPQRSARIRARCLKASYRFLRSCVPARFPPSSYLASVNLFVVINISISPSSTLFLLSVFVLNQFFQSWPTVDKLTALASGRSRPGARRSYRDCTAGILLDILVGDKLWHLWHCEANYHSCVLQLKILNNQPSIGASLNDSHIVASRSPPWDGRAAYNPI